MMKKILTVSLTLTALFIYAQVNAQEAKLPVTLTQAEDGSFSFEKVIEVEM